MAVAEPRVWDAVSAQRATELSGRAGPTAAVVKALVDAIGAVIHAVTRAGAASGWRAQPILSTQFRPCGTGSVRSQSPTRKARVLPTPHEAPPPKDS